MEEILKQELLQSPEIQDKTILEMLSRIIENRFPSIFAKRIKNEIINGHFHVNSNLEKKLRGYVVIHNGNEIHYNTASAIPDIKDPLKGFSNIKELYSVILKGCILNLTQRNSSVLSNAILNASAALFVSLFQDVIFKIGKTRFLVKGNTANLTYIILNYFYSTVVNLETRQAKNEAINLVKLLFKKDPEELKASFMDPKQELEYKFEKLDLKDMCLFINDYFGLEVSPKMFHSYFLANYNFAYLGINNYNEFLAGNYAMLKTGAFSGKLLMTKFSNDSEDFVKIFEKNIKI